jgi:predicted transglutaminase-like cysteine proteinase
MRRCRGCDGRAAVRIARRRPPDLKFTQRAAESAASSRLAAGAPPLALGSMPAAHLPRLVAVGLCSARRRTAWARAVVRVVGALALGLAAGARGADDARPQRAVAAAAPGAQAAARELQSLLTDAGRHAAVPRLHAVNEFFNARIRFATDHEVWGRADHWASPLEVLERGVGDCEDYAIAKYFTLRALGVPASSLRLVYVRARLVDGRSQPHMVLAWYAAPESEPLLLDNLVAAVEPASQRADLTPVFSFNDLGLWQGLGGVDAGAPAARLPHWREVSRRARAEGFF